MDKDYFDDDFEEILNDGSSLDDSQIIYSEPPKTSKNVVKQAKEIKEKAIDTTGKTVQKTGKGIETAGKGINATGVVTEKVGTGAKIAGKGIETAGKGVETASNAIGSALSAIPVVGAPLGAITKGVGGTVGKGAGSLGKGVEKFGEGTEKAGKNMQKTGKQIDEKGKKVSENGKNIRNHNGTQSRIRNSNNKSNVQMQNTMEPEIKSIATKLKDKAVNISGDLKAFFKPFSFSLTDNIKKLKVTLILIVSIFLFLVITIYMIYSPVLDAIEKISEKWDSAKLTVEKTGNLYTGFGYESTKDAFYKELDYLYEDYDEQLDLSLLMATLFYKEKDGYDTKFNQNPISDVGELDELKVGTLISSATAFLKNEFKDVYEDLDEDGKNYTIGKIYRLRKLARNQLDTSLFGNGGVPTEAEEVSLSEFADRVKDRMSSDVYQAIESAPSLLQELNPLNLVKKIYELISIGEGRENFSTTSFGNENEAILALKKLLNETILTGIEFGNIRFDITSLEFKVTIYKYDQNLDNYRKYLHDYYIPNMPEFKNDLIGLKGKKLENKINSIIENIFDYSEEFNDIFGYNKNKSASNYDETCIGNVDNNLVLALKKLPVNGKNYKFNGINAFGISGGTQNNGVNLSKTSASVNEGDEVYSVYSGKVINVSKQSNCNIYEDENCDAKGNYVEIEHDQIRTSGNSFNITTLYSNLKEVKVNKGDIVKIGQIIGTVGQTGDAIEPTVHFEMYDTKTKQYLNPTNLFIPCDNEYTPLYGNENDEKIWCYFTRNLGYSKGKTAGTMANLTHESGLIPYRVQGDFSSGYKNSKDYTNNVDSKKISKSEFVNKGPGGGGYGLAQWTSPGRKENLYNSVKKNSSTSIGDLASQLIYLKKELENSRSWTKNYDTWKNAGSSLTDVKNATSAMMVGFERPKDQSASAINNRSKTGISIYNKFKDKKCESNKNMNDLN